MSAALQLTEVEPTTEVPTDRSPILPPPAKPRDLVFVDLELRAPEAVCLAFVAIPVT